MRDHRFEEEDDDGSSEDEQEEDCVDEMNPRFKLLYQATADALSSQGSRRDRAFAKLHNVLSNDPRWINKIIVDGLYDQTLLDFAVGKADLDVVNMLLYHGADPNVLCGTKGFKHTCVFTACTSRHERTTSIVRALIKHGLDLNAKMPEDTSPQGYNNPYSTALHYVCADWNVEFVKLFLRNRADVNALDIQGRTPLACVVETNVLNASLSQIQAIYIINMLVRYGADIHTVNRLGQTLLHKAAASPRCEYKMHIVQYLVDIGVQDLLDDFGMSAAELAMEKAGSNRSLRHASSFFGTRLQQMFDRRKKNQDRSDDEPITRW
jgi:ankyrin repeat protein